jgi:hypothetical protein
MADPIKSVLLVDYESLQRSLVGTVGDTRLAERTTAWLEALEAGRIGPNVKRTLLVKRAYVGSTVSPKSREQLSEAGFDLVDPAEGSARTSAELNMALDTMEALARPEGVQEFVFISAAGELTPLLTRLKSLKRVSVIYADGATPSSDRNLADAIIEIADFARIVAAEAPPEAEAAAAPAASAAASAGARGDIEAFARRMHAATSIPLFSPKTFAELFRHLVDEIAANGYHFQSTARNVADRMVANGRNVTRRQVVFIVKGLALKGHVFSTTDTPEKLAEVFREQARYLINNAGISLTPHDEELLTAWFQSRPPAAKSAPPAAPVAASAPASAAAQTPKTPPVPEPPDAAKATIAETIEREVAKAVTASRPVQPPGEKIKPPRPQAPPPPPAAAQKPPSVRPVDLPKSAANKPQPLPSAREEAKAVIAARIAGAARMKPAGTRTPIPAKPAPKAPAPAASTPPPEAEAKPVAPPPSAAPPPPSPAESGNPDALESSILAAIAEAVDVLVEDSAPIEPEEEAAPPPPPPKREPPGRRAAVTPPPRQPDPPPPPAKAEEEVDEESNDIGDQIQRIIASYNRNRSEE